MIKRTAKGNVHDVDNIGPGRTPKGMLTAVWCRSRPQGHRESKALGWYRGRHSGWIDSVLVLQKMGHTRIAAKLQEHFELNDDGSIGC